MLPSSNRRKLEAGTAIKINQSSVISAYCSYHVQDMSDLNKNC